MTNMTLRLLLAVAAAACLQSAQAFWRLPCDHITTSERADPIVFPTVAGPVGHAHNFFGGSAVEYNATYDSVSTSRCTSCMVTQDKSLYWMPVLYFRQPDGTYTAVDQSGILVYYLQRGNATDLANMVAFPEGFRMIAGNANLRTYNASSLAQQAITFACLDYNHPATQQQPSIQARVCPNQLRSQIAFPSCWDGVNLDSPDHRSHMAYPDGVDNGNCPPGYPARFITLFYETFWQINDFDDQWIGPKQPFVWSMGDTTSYAFHGDFFNGWDVPVLQNAIHNCTNLSGQIQDCPVFNIQQTSDANQCFADQAPYSEQILGTLANFPGNFPIYNPPFTSFDFTGPLTDDMRFVREYDYTGSITGESFVNLLNPDISFFSGAPGCYVNATLNAAVCPQSYIGGAVYCLDGQQCSTANKLAQVRRTSNDIPFDYNSTYIQSDGWGALWNSLWSVNTSYLGWFTTYTPNTFTIQVGQTVAGDWFEFAFCLPAGAQIVNITRGSGSTSQQYYDSFGSALVPTTSLAQLRTADPSRRGGYYLYDTQRSILIVRLVQRQPRVAPFIDDEISRCGPYGCEYITVIANHNNAAFTTDTCAAVAFSSPAGNSYGSLQVTSAVDGTWFTTQPVPEPRINGVVYNPCPGCININSGNPTGVVVGNTSTFVDARGFVWVGDAAFLPAGSAQASSVQTLGDVNVAGDLSFGGRAIQSSRYGNQFSYLVPVTAAGVYNFTFLFVENYWKTAGSRIFNILVQGQTVFGNVDIAAAVGANALYKLTTSANITAGAGNITIAFVAVKDNALVSAISVVPPGSNITNALDPFGTESTPPPSTTGSNTGNTNGKQSHADAIRYNGIILGFALTAMTLFARW